MSTIPTSGLETKSDNGFPSVEEAPLDESAPLISRRYASVGSLTGLASHPPPMEPVPEDLIQIDMDLVHEGPLTSGVIRNDSMDLGEGPTFSGMARNDSFISTFSEYDLDTGMRFASSREEQHTPPRERGGHHHHHHHHASRSGSHAAALSPAIRHPPHSSNGWHSKAQKSTEEQQQDNKNSHNKTRRNKLIVTMLSVVLVAAVTTVVILVWKAQQQQQEEGEPDSTVNGNTKADDMDDAIASQRRLIFTVSLSASIKLLSAIGLGALAASQKPSPKANHMILDQAAVSALSRLVFWVFQPCFFLCRVAQTFAATSTHGSSQGITRKSLALMPLVALLQICTGSLVAKLVTFFSHRINSDTMSNEERIRVDDSKRDAQVCMTFANSGPLPLLFADALFAGGEGGVAADVTACISFYLLGWSPTFWSYGRHLVGTYGDGSERSNGTPARGVCGQVWDVIKDFGQQVKKVFAPPIIGSTVGIFVGAIPLFRSNVLESDGILYPLFGAMNTLGSAYLPSVILVLAGSLVGGSRRGKAIAMATKNPSGSYQSLEITTLISILLSRFALAPVASIVVVYILTHMDLLPPVGTRTHAIVSFVMLMEGCMPPAQNSILMLQLAGLSARAENMARTVTVMYVLSVIPVTIWLMCMMEMSGVMAFR